MTYLSILFLYKIVKLKLVSKRSNNYIKTTVHNENVSDSIAIETDPSKLTFLHQHSAHTCLGTLNTISSNNAKS